MLYIQKELKNKDNMIQYLLTKLSKQTEFIQKQNYELQREPLVNRNSICSLKTTISVTITIIISPRITSYLSLLNVIWLSNFLKLKSELFVLVFAINASCF